MEKGKRGRGGVRTGGRRRRDQSREAGKSEKERGGAEPPREEFPRAKAAIKPDPSLRAGAAPVATGRREADFGRAGALAYGSRPDRARDELGAARIVAEGKDSRLGAACTATRPPAAHGGSAWSRSTPSVARDVPGRDRGPPWVHEVSRRRAGRSRGRRAGTFDHHQSSAV